MNFKTGDRVVIVKDLDYPQLVGQEGTIVEVGNPFYHIQLANFQVCLKAHNNIRYSYAAEIRLVTAPVTAVEKARAILAEQKAKLEAKLTEVNAKLAILDTVDEIVESLA